MAYDFEAIKRDNLVSDVVGKHLKLKRAGSEFVALCPFHNEKSPSFTISDLKGFYHCFGCSAHGDVIDYVERYHSISRAEAIRYLGGETRDYAPNPRPRPEKVQPFEAAPVPDSHEIFRPGFPIRAWAPKQGSFATYAPDYVWPYYDLTGGLLGYVIRMDSEKSKIFRPLRYIKTDQGETWATVGFDDPRPLYGLDRLKPDGPVLLVEGEKAADAASRLLTDYSVLTWPNGASSVSKADFSPLKGRNVTIWPDNDDPGEKAAHDASQAVIRVGGYPRTMQRDYDRPKGWDVADWQGDDLAAYITSRLPDQDDPPPPNLFDADPFDGNIPPPRPWAFGNILLHRTVTAITAPAGTGKSTWSIQLGIAFSQHITFGPFDPIRTGPVWIWNNEDDKDELNRRTFAACQAMGVPMGSLLGKLYLNSGSERALIVAKEDPKTGEVYATPDVQRCVEIIIKLGIKLLIVDPFAETFELETENSNDAMKRVARYYRDIAQQADCSVLIITHTPKGATSDRSAGDLDAIRGGSAIGGVVRSAWTMFGMSEQDAENFGVPADSRHLYVRLDAAKSNMSLKGSAIIWWRKEGVFLGNGDDDYQQDVVGTLMPVALANAEPKKRELPDERMPFVYDEIIRVALKNGWISDETAQPLVTVSGSLDRKITRLSARAVTDLIIGQMPAVHGHNGYSIILTELPRSGKTMRKIHVEA